MLLGDRNSLSAVWSRLDCVSQSTTRRLALKLATIPILAALTPSAFLDTVELGVVVYSVMAVSHGYAREEPVFDGSLSHWDEALVFGAVWTLLP